MSPERPRLLHAVGAPLGAYYRVGRDHLTLQALIAEDRASCTGLVFDAHLQAGHGELLKATAGKLESVLDTRAFELSTAIGAQNAKFRALPWAGDVLPHSANLLDGPAGQRLVDAIAERVAEQGYSAVLAPTHLLERADDPWLRVDVKLARALRVALDARNLEAVTIYFPLTARAALLHGPAARNAILVALSAAPIDALWLRVHPFGATSAGPLALRRYIESARDLQRLGLPLVAERVGTVGVALMAFGAVGGIEGGITHGERFDVGGLLHARKDDGKPFAPVPRVYLTSIGAFMKRRPAGDLMSKPGMRSLLGCRDTTCCRRGYVDTDLDPRRHFLLQRNREVNTISRAPDPVRPVAYLESFLRPATDIALRAAKHDASLDVTRRRLEGWRTTLGALNQQGPPSTVARAPEGKRMESRLRRPA